MLLTLALLAAQAQDLTLQPGAVCNSLPNLGRAATDCDDFNRADGPMTGNWVQMAGQQNILSNQGYGNVGTGNQWMQSTSANCAASASKDSVVFDTNPGGNLKYAACVLGLGGTNNYYIKVQSQSSTLYNYLGFYVGFNGGGGSYGQFAAITPVAWGRMDVWYDAGTDKMVLDIDEFNDGSVDYTYTSNGPASSVGGLAGTGHGIGTYGDQKYDDWQVNGGCGGGPSFTLAKAGSCPGATTLSTSNGTAGGAVAILYGNAGSSTKPSGTCAGTTVNIANPTLGAIIVANGSGAASLSFNAPAGACGKTVQAVDISTCGVSNAVTL